MSIGFIGLLTAFVACFSWGIGDFLIQKTSRLIGSWKSIFFISLTACIGLFPFIYRQLGNLDVKSLLTLCLVSLIFLFASVFDFEALRSGKIAIVEPIISLELPLTIMLGVIFLGESPSTLQAVLFGGIFFGILFSITTRLEHIKHYTKIFEKGFILAGIGAIGMAMSNFMVGFSSKTVDPLTTLWFMSTAILIFCIFYLSYTKKLKEVIHNFKDHKRIIIPLIILDNLGWVGYALSTSLSPISLTTSISESYIIIAVIMGIIVNKEKLKTHQKIGVVITLICLVILTTTVSE